MSQIINRISVGDLTTQFTNLSWTNASTNAAGTVSYQEDGVLFLVINSTDDEHIFVSLKDPLVIHGGVNILTAAALESAYHGIA